MYSVHLSIQTLAECTGTMDASTWNAYHIISNRARSVCLATRQEHFKRQTEVAVNQLSVSTLHQLSAVRELAVSHQEIKALTQDSLQVTPTHTLHTHSLQVTPIPPHTHHIHTRSYVCHCPLIYRMSRESRVSWLRNKRSWPPDKIWYGERSLTT